MSYPAEFSERLASLAVAFEEDRLAHAYIVHGDPRGLAKAFMEELLGSVLGNPARVRDRSHPDVHFVEPVGRSRSIDIKQMRELCSSLNLSAYGSGWKAGVVVEADRLNAASANALLKTLEEPAPRTLLLLLTANPSTLMPTVVSRCQLVRLPVEYSLPRPEWYDDLVGILSREEASDSMEALVLADAYASLLKSIEQGIKEEEVQKIDGAEELPKEVVEARIAARLLEAARDMMLIVQAWRRDRWVLALDPASGIVFTPHAADLERQAARLGAAEAEKSLVQVEETLYRIQRKIRPGTAFTSDLFRTALRGA